MPVSGQGKRQLLRLRPGFSIILRHGLQEGATIGIPAKYEQPGRAFRIHQPMYGRVAPANFQPISRYIDIIAPGSSTIITALKIARRCTVFPGMIAPPLPNAVDGFTVRHQQGAGMTLPCCLGALGYDYVPFRLIRNIYDRNADLLEYVLAYARIGCLQLDQI